MSVPKIQAHDWANMRPELKAGRVEILGAFLFWVREVKKIAHATEEKFDTLFEEFKRS